MSVKYGCVGNFISGDASSSKILNHIYRENNNLFTIPLEYVLDNHEYSRQVVCGVIFHFKIPLQNSRHNQYVRVLRKLDNTYQLLGTSIV